MVIGTVQLEIRFYNPQSLKEKRMILKSLVTRVRNQFNVSIAEIDGMDLWQSSSLAVAAVGLETKRVNQILSHVMDFVRSDRQLEVIKEQMEFF